MFGLLSNVLEAEIFENELHKGRQLMDCLNLHRINHDPMLGNDEAQQPSYYNTETAFQRVQPYFVLLTSVENIPKVSRMVSSGHCFISPSDDTSIFFEKGHVYLNFFWGTIGSNQKIRSDFGIRRNVDWYSS